VQQQHLDQAWVPFQSPSRERAAAQNASCACVNAPLARAWTRAVAPGSAPGLPATCSDVCLFLVVMIIEPFRSTFVNIKTPT